MPGRRGAEGWYGRGGGRSAWRGGVAGRARHHHQGRGSSSNTWVRPRDDEISFVSTEETAASAVTLEGGGSSDTTSDASSVSSSSISKGPILSGPTNRNHFFMGGRGRGRGRGRGGSSVRGGRGGRGRLSYHSSQTWRRGDATTTTTHTENDGGDATEAFQESGVVGGGAATTMQSSVSVNNEVPVKVQDEQSIPDLKKVGTNKLVLSKKKTPAREIDLEVVSRDKNSGKMALPTSNSTAIAPPTKRTAAKLDPPGRQIIAKGRNKLVLAKTTNQMGSSNPVEPKVPGIGPSKQQQEEATTTIMIATGSNKLVSVKRSADDGKQFKSHNNAYRSNNNGCRNPNSTNWDQSQKRSRSPANTAPTIKRIKLGVAAAATTAEGGKDSVRFPQEGEMKTNADDGSKGKDTTTASKSEALTDFAYRETSSTRPWGGGRFSTTTTRGGGGGGRGGGRYSRYQHQSQRPMGLVRVNPNESKAPICPTFLRGIRCENVRCLLRHDVPRESAMPICSFFQRHGQCLKGSDCPFRHVKVNPGAMLCPRFFSAGYCDDDQCIMKHVAVNSNNNKKLKKGR